MKQYSKIDYKINSMILIVSSLVLVLIGSFDLADYGINWIGYIYIALGVVDGFLACVNFKKYKLAK